MSTYRILLGDVLDQLRTLPDESVHCVVTSPPYWGLRDYGVEGQLGLEKAPQEFIAKMVEVFREVRRVLRKDGTCWVNMGDSYAGGGWGTRAEGSKQRTSLGSLDAVPHQIPSGLKGKDLCGIPWRLAFALQDDGWWLRQDIIWSKPNPMPESVSDRCTKAHEYIFLLTKSQRYFYDAEAIKEEASSDSHARTRKQRATGAEASTPDAMRNGIRPAGVGPKGAAADSGVRYNESFSAAVTEVLPWRNKRSVWEIATEPFPEAHFATFPTELVKPCILAGTSEKGCCATCGAPYSRIVETERSNQSGSGKAGNQPEGKGAGGTQVREDHDIRMGPTVSSRTLGWSFTCICDAPITPCTVMDPFSGAGTTAVVALRHGRNFIGIELNPEYREMSLKRIQADNPMFNVEEVEACLS